jgi:hypothetical protein
LEEAERHPREDETPASSADARANRMPKDCGGEASDSSPEYHEEKDAVIMKGWDWDRSRSDD